jgi:hypothetical protein
MTEGCLMFLMLGCLIFFVFCAPRWQGAARGARRARHCLLKEPVAGAEVRAQPPARPAPASRVRNG